RVERHPFGLPEKSLREQVHVTQPAVAPEDGNRLGFSRQHVQLACYRMKGEGRWLYAELVQPALDERTQLPFKVTRLSGTGVGRHLLDRQEIRGLLDQPLRGDVEGVHGPVALQIVTRVLLASDEQAPGVVGQAFGVVPAAEAGVNLPRRRVRPPPPGSLVKRSV